MSDFRTQIESLINSKKGTDYVISSLGVTAESSSEMKDTMITELVSLVCILEDENNELEENCNNLATALNQVTATLEEFHSKYIEKKSLWKRIFGQKKMNSAAAICFRQADNIPGAPHNSGKQMSKE